MRMPLRYPFHQTSLKARSFQCLLKSLCSTTSALLTWLDIVSLVLKFFLAVGLKFEVFLRDRPQPDGPWEGVQAHGGDTPAKAAIFHLGEGRGGEGRGGEGRGGEGRGGEGRSEESLPIQGRLLNQPQSPLLHPALGCAGDIGAITIREQHPLRVRLVINWE